MMPNHPMLMILIMVGDAKEKWLTPTNKVFESIPLQHLCVKYTMLVEVIVQWFWSVISIVLAVICNIVCCSIATCCCLQQSEESIYLCLSMPGISIGMSNGVSAITLCRLAMKPIYGWSLPMFVVWWSRIASVTSWYWRQRGVCVSMNSPSLIDDWAGSSVWSFAIFELFVITWCVPRRNTLFLGIIAVVGNWLDDHCFSESNVQGLEGNLWQTPWLLSGCWAAHGRSV